MTLAPVHDDATIDEAVAARARELGGYLIAADAGLGSVPLEVSVTRRWSKPDSNSRSRRRDRLWGPFIRQWDWEFESGSLQRRVTRTSRGTEPKPASAAIK